MAATIGIPLDFYKFAVFVILKQTVNEIVSDVIPHAGVSELHGIAVLSFQEVAVNEYAL